jgi:hypothetical protein
VSWASLRALSVDNTSRNQPGRWQPCARGGLTRWTWWPSSSMA